MSSISAFPKHLEVGSSLICSSVISTLLAVLVDLAVVQGWKVPGLAKGPSHPACSPDAAHLGRLLRDICQTAKKKKVLFGPRAGRGEAHSLPQRAASQATVWVSQIIIGKQAALRFSPIKKGTQAQALLSPQFRMLLNENSPDGSVPASTGGVVGAWQCLRGGPTHRSCSKAGK